MVGWIPVELTGLEPRRSDLARGIVIARSAVPLTPAAQRALWASLAAAGVTEAEDPASESRDELAEEEIERQWLAAPWLPPVSSDLEAQRAALELAAATHGLDAIWCFKVETGIDGLTWLELSSSEPLEDISDDSEDPTKPVEVVDAIFDEQAEVLYSAPDAPPATEDDEDDVGDEDELEDDTGDLDEDITSAPESHWRNGAPPMEHSVASRSSATRDHRRLRLGELRHRPQARGDRTPRRGVRDQRVLRAVAVRVPGRAVG